MATESDGATSLRFSPHIVGLLAFGWTAAVAFVYLFRYDGWLVVRQLGYLAALSLPTFRVGPHFGEFWLSRLADEACVLAMYAAAFAVGSVAIDRLTPKKDLLAALFSLAVGFWVLAVATLCVGAVSVASIPWGLVLMACWVLPAPRSYLRRQASVGTPWPKVMLALVIAAAVVNVAGAMSPPFEYDELEYHLGSLADYQPVGRIVFLPHNFYSNLPQLAEMLYLLAMTTSSDIAAKLVHWSFGVIGTVAVYAVATRLWSRNIGMTAAALFYCVPFVQDLSSTARIDLVTTFFAVLAFVALLTESTWLSAMMAGCAVATKWTAVPIVLLPVMIFSFKSVRVTSGHCLLAAAFVLPWLLKNWLLTGNPVYPLLYGVFPNPHWSAQQAALFAQKHYPHFGLMGLRQLWELPWQVSFTENGAVPVLLMMAPLILLARNAARPARRAAWMFVAAYAGWYLLTFRPWRFLFPAFPLAAMVGAYALEVVGKWIRMAVGVLLLVGMSAMGLNLWIDVENPERVPAQMSFLTYALGQQSREEFVARMGRGTFEPIVWMNHNLPADATVLYIGEARAYYAKQHVLWSTAFDQHPLTTMTNWRSEEHTSEL